MFSFYYREESQAARALSAQGDLNDGGQRTMDTCNSTIWDNLIDLSATLTISNNS